MKPNNNLSVLPFYLNIEEQNHRKSYAYGEIYPLYTPVNYLPPFQIMRDVRDNAPINGAYIYDAKGVQMYDATDELREQATIARFNDYEVIVFPSLLPLNLNMAEGQYYLRLTDGVQTWYSEIFTCVGNITPYLKIEWGDAENCVFDDGIIVYKNPFFKNKLYLCTELGKPEYPFEEEGEQRDGYFFATKQISEKTYRCTILAPEYLCDVMRLIRMADNVRVTDKYGRIYDCDTFLITPTWQTQGNLASVEIEFQTDTIVKKIGRGYTIHDIGDFNADFNNDYNNN